MNAKVTIIKTYRNKETLRLADLQVVADLRAENGFRKEYPVKQTQTVSTIGAGDNFNAGFIFGLLKYGITHRHIESGLTKEQWDNIIECAQAFSAETCKSLFNYVSVEFGKQQKA